MATERLRTIRPSGGDYTSGSAWEAGEQADLVAADEYRVGEIQGDWSAGGDNTPVTILGWTTDPTRYIELRSAGSARHAGKWTTTAHRMEVGDNSGVTVSENYVRVIGLQVKVSSSSSSARLAFATSTIDAGGSEILFDKCLAWGDVAANTAANTTGFRGSDGDATIELRNCIAWDWVTNSGANGAGFVCAGAVVTATNCTAHGCRIGFNRSTGTMTARNCGSAAHTSSGFSGTISQTTCSSSTPTFVDEAGDDFHLASSDTTWKDAGTDYSGTFTDDIDGATRSGSWDIGADEYTTASGAISGSASGSGSATAALSASGSLAGALTAAATTAAALVGECAASGTLSGTATASAALLGSAALVGSSAGAATVSGTLEQPSGSAAGTAAGSATASATLTASGALAGASAGSATVVASVGGGQSISGTASGSCTIEGTLVGLAVLIGTSAGAASISGSITGAGALLGTATGTSTASLGELVVPPAWFVVDRRRGVSAIRRSSASILNRCSSVSILETYP